MTMPRLASSRWWYIMPIVFVTYSLAYLDRANYGFAAASGMADDLRITPGLSSLLERAGRVLDRATAEPDAESVAAASIAVAEARALTTEVALLAGSKLIELGGSRACLAELGLDRHWRNARVHTLHDPVRWKYHAVGDYYLNGRLPPRRGTL